MNLEQAMTFTALKLQTDDFKSDGCTLAPDLGIHRFCQMHDCLLKYRPKGMTRAKIDSLFYQGIRSKGLRYLPVAVIYYICVRTFGILKEGL